MYDGGERKGGFKERNNVKGVEAAGQGEGGIKEAMGTVGESHC